MSPTLEEFCERYFAGSLTPEEAKALTALLDGDAEARKAFVDFARQWSLLGMALRQMEVTDEVVQEVRPRSAVPVRRTRLWGSLGALAAAAVIAAGLWWGWENGRQPVKAGSAFGGKTEDGILAKVVEADGECGMRNAEGSTRALKTGDEVHAGDRIETGKDGKVRFAYIGEQIAIETFESSVLVCVPSVDGGKQLNLERGKLSATVAKQPEGKPFVVETPQARVTVVGTKFTLLAAGSGSRVDVDEGCVEMTTLATGRKVSVEAGLQSVVLAGGDVPAIYGQTLFADDFERGLDNWEICFIDAKGVITPADSNIMARAKLTASPKGGKCVTVDATGMREGGIALVLKKSFVERSGMATFDQKMDGDGAWSGCAISFTEHSDTISQKKNSDMFAPSGTWSKGGLDWKLDRPASGGVDFTVVTTFSGQTNYQAKSHLAGKSARQFEVLWRVDHCVGSLDNFVIRSCPPALE